MSRPASESNQEMQTEPCETQGSSDFELSAGFEEAMQLSGSNGNEAHTADSDSELNRAVSSPAVLNTASASFVPSALVHCGQKLVDNPFCQLKNFDIEKKIGRGQFSVVYKAKCKTTGTIVALKKIQVSSHCFRSSQFQGCSPLPTGVCVLVG